MKIKPDTRTNDLKDILFDILAAKKIKNFTVNFEGSGDSGQVEDISSEVPDKVLQEKVEGVKLPNGHRYNGNKMETVWKDAENIEDVIRSICYEILGLACSGWEINDGSYGEFNFDVENRKVSLDFNERITDVKSSTYEF